MNNDNEIINKNISSLEDRYKEIIKRIEKSNAFTQDDGSNNTLLQEIKDIDDDTLVKTLNEIKQCLCDNKYKDNVTEHIYTFYSDGNLSSIGQRRLHNIVIYVLKGIFPADTEVAKSTNNKFKHIVEKCGFTQEEKKDVVVQTIEDKVKLLTYQKQIILQGPPGTGKTRLAKIIARSIIKSEEEANIDDIKEQVTLIQFHPSYSYEDFVRGIVAKTEEGENGGIKYVVENKILAQMAQKAKDSLGEEYFKKNTTKERKKEILEKSDKFIVIIDEINRANLSSVLGELIYALEYRDEVVESMYALEKDKNGKPIESEKQREIILPKNLYIIGTMNTADRSVGHIDYAIRRRFSFESVLPDKLVPDDKELFEKVEALFYEDKKAKIKAKSLSIEFFPDDVQLGHSYFIGKLDELDKKLQYQVKPLLHEYIKDGVLEENSKIGNEKISDYIDSLRVTLSDESS